MRWYALWVGATFPDVTIGSSLIPPFAKIVSTYGGVRDVRHSFYEQRCRLVCKSRVKSKRQETANTSLRRLIFLNSLRCPNQGPVT